MKRSVPSMPIISRGTNRSSSEWLNMDSGWQHSVEAEARDMMSSLGEANVKDMYSIRSRSCNGSSTVLLNRSCRETMHAGERMW